MEVVGPPKYGQSYPSGQCANWRLKFINRSNTEIVKIVFDPSSAQYSNYREFNQETQQHAPPIPAEDPAPTVIDVSLPPYSEQVLSFQSCTRTPPPENRNYEFGTTSPGYVDYWWITGHRGRALY